MQDPIHLVGSSYKLASHDPIQPSGCPPIYVCGKIVPCFPEIRETGQWVGLEFCMGRSFPSLGLLGNVIPNDGSV
jgi:hypothetical protein